MVPLFATRRRVQVVAATDLVLVPGCHHSPCNLLFTKCSISTLFSSFIQAKMVQKFRIFTIFKGNLGTIGFLLRETDSTGTFVPGTPRPSVGHRLTQSEPAQEPDAQTAHAREANEQQKDTDGGGEGLVEGQR